MGIFSGGIGGHPERITPSQYQEQPCKPEYEKMIANAKEQKKATSNLFSALMDYVKVMGGQHDAAFHVMIGALLVEMGELDKAISGLIAQQEAEAK